ncbi:MAG: DUF2157 domain-containing protein [Proteobacteria bacterium]|nr:DUF2157 domain-containing protein [Pseudomonadota bacterium]NDD04581.1 DUF2157 domain-containing protein [Pseudomonadota bacterium]NDG26485.1 DUF2157 domain-containing protein [Pseudomonadota bacterium]
MSKLEKQLKSWISRGLISSDQASAILNFEKEKPSASWFIYGVLTLGVSVLIFGIVSLVAVNWDLLPKELKLGGAFALLGITGFIAYQMYLKKQPIFFDAAILALNLLVIGTITLVGYLYGASGNRHLGLSLWSLLTLPTALLTYFPVVPFVWFGGFMWALAECFEALAASRYDWINFFMAPLFTAFVGILARLIGTSSGFTKALNVWFLIWGTSAIVEFEFTSSYSYMGRELSPEHLLPGGILAAFFLGLVWGTQFYNRFQKSLITWLIVTFAGFFCLRYWRLLDSSKLADQCVSAAFTIIVLSLVGLLFASKRERLAFNYILGLLAIRCFFLCIQSFGEFSIGGFGLIVSGLILIGLAILWHKKKNEIAVWAEKWTEK